jgi:protein regulator of cytokinesis 1
MPLNRRLSLGIQHLGSNSINSATQGISFIKEGGKAQGEKMFARLSLASHLRDETASVVSTFSGPVSP